MSMELFEYVKDFVNHKIKADDFAEEYISKFYEERKDGILAHDADKLGELFGSIFCAADMYSPEELRTSDNELTEEQLRAEIKRLINRYETNQPLFTDEEIKRLTGR